MLLLLFLSIFQLVQANDADIIIGGSIYQENEESENSEYVRGAICFLNKIIDSKMSPLPKAIFYENGNKPSRDLSNTRRLVYSDKASVLFGYSNMAGLMESVKELKNKKVPIAFPFTSLSAKEMEENKERVFYLRPSIEMDLKELANFMNKSPKKRVALIYESGLAWQRDYMKSLLSQKEIFEGEYIPESGNMNSILLDTKHFVPDFVVVLGNPKMVVDFTKRAYFTSVKNSTLLVPFYASGSKLIKELKNLKIDLFLNRIFPNIDSDDEIVKEYKKVSKKYKPEHEIGESGLEGFITASVLYSILKKVDIHDEKSILDAFFKFEAKEFTKLRTEQYGFKN